ncbi:negative regulator of systemic acquired resistance (SNI1 [Striga hermonthica]|uniref:Negative regulator of systemic acquired resistance (SNI1) n=1 Tax=Striga hermonthica TaxID=68872 RepID=A0A9N7MZV4_STRHE|nr:negative regulator of systemic acquired resistance (SNI1 [Striga hermonthica]
MDKRRRIEGKGGGRGVEENTMALLDTSGFSSSKIAHHLDDDRLAFLEAVRTASLLPDNGSAPTPKMCEAIFRILKDVDSLDLIIESYQLLVELDKRFPRVYLSKDQNSSSPLKITSQVILVEEAWLPFNLGLDSYREKGTGKNHLVDAAGFHAIIQEIAEMAKELKSEAKGTTFLKNMLLLQYLITVLERDFLPRIHNYHESMNWNVLRESLLSLLLGSRKVMYKGLTKDCLLIMCNMFQSPEFSEETSAHESSTGELLHETNRAVALALPDAKKSTCTVLKKLFVMIMELDSSRKIADQQGLTSRADGVRTPIAEIILDELIYDNDILYSFLQVFDPKWKLDIIVQYFQKYIPKACCLLSLCLRIYSSVQTRRSSDKINIDNFDGILKCLSNSNRTRSIIKKMSSEVVQLLLAYAFQAYVELSYHASEGLSNMAEHDKSNSVVEVCKNIVSAFTCLKQEDP